MVVARNGNGPGYLLTGGVHGDEYEGPIVAPEAMGRPLTRMMATPDLDCLVLSPRRRRTAPAGREFFDTGLELRNR